MSINREQLVAIIILLIVASGLVIYWTSSSAVVRIFHAGSLSQPFEKINEENNSFNLQCEPSGSVEVMRKVTELRKKPDIVAVSDYSLIQDYLIPKHTDWYVQFARNEMVIAYTSESAYSSEINENNWFEILGRPDVKFAFGDPNADPGGYRAMMAIQLAEDHYDNSRIFDDLIAANTAMVAPTLKNGAYTLEAIHLGELSPNTSKVKVGTMEVAVIPALKEGSVDYMFNYRSIAKQYDFQFIGLPDEINLSKVEYAENYARARVKLSDGKTKGKPIVYGITILKNAERRANAIKFLKYLFSANGQVILEDLGQPPINPPRANDLEKVPKELQDLVIQYED